MKAPLSPAAKELLNDHEAYKRFSFWMMQREYGPRDYRVEGTKTVFNEATGKTHLEIQGRNGKSFNFVMEGNRTLPGDDVINVPEPKKKNWVRKLLNI